MGAHDFQMGVKDESVYGTAVTVDRFFEYNGDVAPVTGVAGRTEGNALRVGSRTRRQARVVPYFDHAEGTIPLDFMNKGMGFFLKHMLPNVATTGAGPFVHTATEGSSSLSIGKSFTLQMNYPFHPAGTNQAVTFAGGKVPRWTLHCAADEMLQVDLDVWFNSMTTATALATASYPTSMTNFAWVHGVISIGGSAVDLTSISCEVDQGYNLERAAIRGNAAKKEPTPGVLGITWEAECDFESLTQWNRVHATSVASLSAAIIATFTNGADIVTLTLPAARFDELSFGGERGGLMQTVGGVAEYDGTNSPITLALTTSDTTP